MKVPASLIACGCAAIGLLADGATLSFAQEPQEPAPPAPSAAVPATPPAPQYSRKGADTCIACHDDAKVLSLFKTRHGRRGDPRSPFGHGNLQCEACHGPGGVHAGRVRSGQERPPIPHYGSNSLSSAAEANGMCLGCHQRDLQHGWQDSVHERDGHTCASCHRMHAARDPVLMTATQPPVCFECHAREKGEAHLPFTHPVRQGQMACSGCHDPHGTATDFNLVRQTLNDTCYACHADKRGPFLWEHAPVTEDCSLCHRPHGSAHPALLTARAPVLCQQCHSQQGHPSVPLDASGLPGGSPTPLFLGQACVNCHSQVHGSNHPSGTKLMR